LWSRIESELHDAPKTMHLSSNQKKETPIRQLNTLRKWIPLAAMLIVAIGAFTRIISKSGNTKIEISVADTSHPLMQELQNVEPMYSQLVSDKTGQIRNNPSLNNDDAEVALEFLTELETEYSLLQNDLGTQIDAGKVLEAMIDNYRQRIEVLEQMTRLLNTPSEAEQVDR
jgi:hypothetical protein